MGCCILLPLMSSNLPSGLMLIHGCVGAVYSWAARHLLDLAILPMDLRRLLVASLSSDSVVDRLLLYEVDIGVLL